jgi:hypothetical protein
MDWVNSLAEKKKRKKRTKHGTRDPRAIVRILVDTEERRAQFRWCHPTCGRR